jgi:hypothetical protein
MRMNRTTGEIGKKSKATHYNSKPPKPAPLLIERDGRLIIQIPLEMKRRANRKTIIPPPGWRDVEEERPEEQFQEQFQKQALPTHTTAPLSPRVNLPLATAIARGFLWLELIESGEYLNVTALAEHLNIDRAYVARHIRMTLLSPGMVRRILQGDEPEGLTMSRLRGGFPMDWEAQERDLCE